MGYVAVSGGKEAIERSIRLLADYRRRGETDVAVEAIRDRLSLLVDRVMGEAGLWAPDYAALALKQSEGSVEEAVFLLRAYRSTLTRDCVSLPLDGAGMRPIRRISAAYKDILGGQLLGPTYDYTQRLLDFELERKDAAAAKQPGQGAREPVEPMPRVSSMLKKQGLIAPCRADDAAPDDVTLEQLTFPASRSARLQTFARADTGFVSGLAYSSLRGYGAVHPTVGELRCGWLEVEIPYLYDEEQTLCIGDFLLTEVEVFAQADDAQKGVRLAVGYGAVFGRNENKAIATAILDRCLEEGGGAPTADEEFVLLHGDSLEMNGFLSHLKLPHYVTFQSKLDSVRQTRMLAEEQARRRQVENAENVEGE